MNKYYSSHFPGTKAYLSEADPSAQHCYNICSDEFDVKVKLWLLLFDHLILSSGHMIESTNTYIWLKQNEKEVGELASKGAILPSLRNDREDFLDFVNLHPKHKEEPWGKRLSINVQRDRARFLNDVFENAITWSPKSESSWFKKSLIFDLIRSKSPLRKRLVGLSNKSIEDLKSKLENTDLLSRHSFWELIRAYCPKYQKVFRRYADIFYHISGALEKDAYPLLHNNESLLCREKVSDESIQLNGLQDYELWQEILSNWQITPNTLRNISLSQIRQIREDIIGKRVLNTWANLIKSTSMKKNVKRLLINHIEAQSLLIKEFSDLIQKQRKVYGRWRRIRSYLEVIAWATGGLEAILGTILVGPAASIIGIGTGILGILSGELIMKKVERKSLGAELLLLSAKVRD